MIEIKVSLVSNKVWIKKFDGQEKVIMTDDKIKYWDVIAEYCECADKCGLVPEIKIVP